MSTTTSKRKRVVVRKKTSAPAKKKAAPKKAAAKKTTARKTSPRKAAAKKTTKRATRGPSPLKGKPATWIEKDKHGFAKGSMLSKVAEILVKGGVDRREVIVKAREVIGGDTSNGKERNVAVAVHNTLTKLQERGYTVQSSWKVVPPKKARAKK